MSVPVVITRSEENQVWRVIRSAPTSVNPRRKLGRDERRRATPRHGTGIRAKNRNELVNQLAEILDWVVGKVNAALTALLNRRNRALRFTGDGRVVAVNAPVKKARAAAVRAGHRSAVVNMIELPIVETVVDQPASAEDLDDVVELAEPVIPAEWEEFKYADPDDPELIRSCTRQQPPAVPVRPQVYMYRRAVTEAILTVTFAPVRKSLGEDVLDHPELVAPYDTDWELNYAQITA